SRKKPSHPRKPKRPSLPRSTSFTRTILPSPAAAAAESVLVVAPVASPCPSSSRSPFPPPNLNGPPSTTARRSTCLHSSATTSSRSSSPVCLKSGNEFTSSSQATPWASTRKSTPNTSNALASGEKCIGMPLAAASKTAPVASQICVNIDPLLTSDLPSTSTSGRSQNFRTSGGGGASPSLASLVAISAAVAVAEAAVVSFCRQVLVRYVCGTCDGR
ncbi:hypothetical protein PoMZ_09568, partial [Pyricularia oryzae]